MLDEKDPNKDKFLAKETNLKFEPDSLEDDEDIPMSED